MIKTRTIFSLAVLSFGLSLQSQTIQSLIDSACPGSTIHLPAGVHRENLNIWKSLTLVGKEVFLESAITIQSNVNVTLRNLTVQKTTHWRGALWNQGRARIENCSFIRNGNDETVGAIYNEGVMTVYRSVLSNNLAWGTGGIGNKGRLTVIESQISHSGPYPKGGLGIANSGYLHLLRSTVYANGSGGIYNEGTALIEHSTLAPNLAYPFGQKGIEIVNDGKMLLRHSTVVSFGSLDYFLGPTYRFVGVRNSNRMYASHTIFHAYQDYDPVIINYLGPPVSMIGELRSLGHNLISNTNRFHLPLEYFTIPGYPHGTVFALINQRTTDIVGLGLDPLLGPLQDNGGPTLTYTLLPGSPAINAGRCKGRELDQRGIKRDKRCDIGAVENAKFKKEK